MNPQDFADRIDAISARLAQIDSQYAGKRMPDGVKAERTHIVDERALLQQSLDAHRDRRQQLEAVVNSANPGAVEQVTQAGAPAQTYRRNPWAIDQHTARGADLVRDQALEVLEHYSRSGVLNAAAADRADRVLRHADATGDTAAYITAVGNPAYASAFAKMLADPIMGHNRFSPEEVEAVRQVTRVQSQIRNAMSETSGAAGGFAIPLTLDPSIIITGQGALNPIRDVASVETIGTREWDGVSTDSVTAGYVAEAVAATDASPTLAQPNIRTQQGRAVVRASIELFQDWSRIQAEMARLVEDARNTVDATQMLTGFTNSPVGVLAIGFTGGLSTTQRVLSAATNSYAVGDPWLLKAQIPPRFIGNATFASAPSIWDTTYRFVGGNSAEPLQMPSRGGDMMGRPKIEWSTMTTGTVTGARLMIGGDFRTGFKIVDRLGMTAEIIPHAFDVTNNMPTGERMIYAYWRTGSAVVAPNALRYLEIK
jgi:HK97 family phage major capsid protein